MSENKISVIIINFNCSDETLFAVQTVRSHLRQNDEIVIVDNGSRVEEVEKLSRLKEIVILNPENLGFGKGCNIGVERSSGDFIFFLNPDVHVKRVNFELWIEGISNKGWAAVGPRIIYPDGSPQPNGGGEVSGLTFVMQLLRLGYLYRRIKRSPFKLLLSPVNRLASGIFKTYLESQNSVEPLQSFTWMSGAALFLQRKTFDHVGGFDPKIFLYNEDEDLCFRLRSVGAILRDNDSLIIHSQGVTQSANRFRVGKGARSRFLSNLYVLKKRKFLISSVALRILYIAWFSASSILMILFFRVDASYDRLKLLMDLLDNSSTEARS